MHCFSTQLIADLQKRFTNEIMLDFNKPIRGQASVPIMFQFLRDPYFVGRDDVLRDLGDRVSKPGVHHRIDIAGISGIGYVL